MRYLVAKRVLSDLSVLVSQLRPYCEASVTDTENNSYEKPTKTATFSSRPMAAPASATTVASSSRSPRPFLLRHKTANSLDSSPSRATQPLPLHELVGRIAEFVEAVMSFPFQLRRGHHQQMAKPAPSNSPTAGENTMVSPPPPQTGATSRTCSPSPGVGDSGPTLANSAAAAASGGDRGFKNGVGSISGGGGGVGEVCRCIVDLKDGSLAASPACARTVTSAPGTLRVTVELLSLLASMAGAGGQT